MESCEICGDDLRRSCSQGHVSGAGLLFCDTCGELLPLSASQPAMAPAAPLTMEYSTGSFADFIAGGDDDPGTPSGSWPLPVPLDWPAPEDLPELADVATPVPVDEPVAQAVIIPEPRTPEPLLDFGPAPESGPEQPVAPGPPPMAPGPEPPPEPVPEPGPPSILEPIARAPKPQPEPLPEPEPPAAEVPEPEPLPEPEPPAAEVPEPEPLAEPEPPAAEVP